MDPLKLEHQLCFSLYSSARIITRKYKTYLDPLSLTYTQYICMLVLWERDHISVKELGEKLLLDSGTLTPLIKKLEKLSYLKRVRSDKDERMVLIVLTDKGRALKDDAKEIPQKIAYRLNMDINQLADLKHSLDEFIAKNPD